ncbi:molybdopterin oxidoreductase [Desulfitobacterium hafniense DCB-2]|uniref:Molybdopterin oxidoreductase n=1 Tax=Desulfitobacterium hafniense (strain DSM 10664 / DCB-2) TaxID=272564 RepID=B8G140_DESHD|nr:molybdopterin-dependent oxidoreductase [Desulfitobacterium hafniense]ACL19255.1 molybdopterin oxidoreductase [Desulfitobacterium hafniense DCB-2]
MNLSRRKFLQGATTLGATVAIAPLAFAKSDVEIPSWSEGSPAIDTLDTDPSVQFVHSVCLGCRSDCNIRGKVKDGVVIKIDGNPYSQMTLDKPLEYSTDPQEARKEAGKLCPRGQAGVQVLYDPLRVQQPLKRVGKRGENKWQTISWEQAYEEIIEGGDLFGEGKVEGLRAVRDMDTLIDPEAPELGPKANQFVFLAGRIENARSDLSKRFVNGGLGSLNWFEHTTACEQSHHIASDHTFAGKHHLKPDFENAKLILNFGANYGEANFPMNGLSRKMVNFLTKGGKMITVDPRFSVSASHSDTWVPIIPGGDGAFALGMIQWIITNERYDKSFLEAPTKEAAAKRGESSWSDATYLVREDNGEFLHGDAAGLGGTKEDYVVLVDGALTLAAKANAADLFGEVTVNSIRCKTVFQKLSERASEKSLAQYAELSGIPEELMIKVADEFTSYGKLAVADFYRGTAQHTNGFHICRAICILNLLVGNIDHRGGYQIGGSTTSYAGDKGLYKIADLNPGALKPKGIRISREQINYEESTEFKKKGYPAKRPWFPLSKDVYQEAVAGIVEGYPYPCKILWLHMGTPAYSVPAIKESLIESLKDTQKIPLFISTDIVIGDTSMFADYILPDVTYMEQWCAQGAGPTILGLVSSVRQPMTHVFPNTKSLENIMIDIAKKMGFPNFGDNGFGTGMPLNKEEDWYFKLVANLATQYGKIPGATVEDQVQYILDRGGIFDSSGTYDGLFMKNKLGKLCNIYAEKVATTVDSMTGKNFDGLPLHLPVMNAKDQEIRDDGYPFIATTYKPAFQSHSRTVNAPWLMEVLPENFIEMNDEEGEKLGFKDGDVVKVSGPTSKEGVVGKLRLRPGMRPGVVSTCIGYGHWHYGSADTIIDEKTVAGDKRRSKGVNINYAMRLDDSIGNVCLQDKIGGSCSFYDSHVKIEKA